MPDLLPPGISLRPVQDGDREFMAALFAANRQAELALFPFDDRQKALFLQSQFEAQQHHYFSHYPTDRFAIIEHQGLPVGRWLVAQQQQALRIVDIALMPSHQGQGIGSVLIRRLQAEATANRQAIELQVTPTSPARTLYERLGFQASQGDDLYLAMAWQPAVGAC